MQMQMQMQMHMYMYMYMNIYRSCYTYERLCILYGAYITRAHFIIITHISDKRTVSCGRCEVRSAKCERYVLCTIYMHYVLCTMYSTSTLHPAARRGYLISDIFALCGTSTNYKLQTTNYTLYI
jgi:hypothetical protein